MTQYDPELHCLCDQCGKISHKLHSRKRFCDDICRTKWHREKAAAVRKMEKENRLASPIMDKRFGPKVHQLPTPNRAVTIDYPTPVNETESSAFDTIDFKDFLEGDGQ